MKTAATTIPLNNRMREAWCDEEARSRIQAAQHRLADRTEAGWVKRFLVRLLMVLRI